MIPPLGLKCKIWFGVYPCSSLGSSRKTCIHMIIQMCKQLQIKLETLNQLSLFNLKSNVMEQREKKTAPLLTDCSVVLLSDVLHHQLDLFSHTPANKRFPVRLSNYIDAFSQCEWALQFGGLAWLCEWTLLWLALLIAPLVMSLAAVYTPICDRLCYRTDYVPSPPQGVESCGSPTWPLLHMRHSQTLIWPWISFSGMHQRRCIHNPPSTSTGL